MTRVINICCYAVFGFCAFSVAAEELKLGDVNYKVDAVYEPIYGSPAGGSYLLNYCLPDLIPAGKAGCGRGSPENNKKIVQVEYEKFIGRVDGASPLLETVSIFDFPFSSDIKISSDTPYAKEYEKNAAILPVDKIPYRPVAGGHKIRGLVRYESSISPFWIWVPDDLIRYKTKIGNPIAFVCSSYSCTFIQDLKNGWVVSARFSEDALQDWQGFYLKINESARVMVGD